MKDKKCKECVRFDVCRYSALPSICFEGCSLFKAKDAVIELPCKVGDYVVWDNGICKHYKKVIGFSYNTFDIGVRLILEDSHPVVGHDAIKKYVPREEAENALKGAKNDAEIH